jgi:hypothetical protein
MIDTLGELKNKFRRIYKIVLASPALLGLLPLLSGQAI